MLVPQKHAAGIAKCPSRIWYYVHHWLSLSHRVAQKEKVSFWLWSQNFSRQERDMSKQNIHLVLSFMKKIKQPEEIKGFGNSESLWFHIKF